MGTLFTNQAASYETGANISSAAWDGKALYIAGLSITIDGHRCLGSLRAVNPANGAFLWQDCLSQLVMAAVSVIPGVALIGAGASLMAVATATGQTLFEYRMSDVIYAASSISNGTVYVGNADGTLSVFGL